MTLEMLDVAVPYTLARPMHEVEDIFRLLQPLGIEGKPGLLTVVAPPEETVRARERLASLGGGPVIGLHVSARKPRQRWPKENFATLARVLAEKHDARLMLFWSPGSADNPHHPGDDEKAAWIVGRTRDLPLVARPTARLTELMGACGLRCGDMLRRRRDAHRGGAWQANRLLFWQFRRKALTSLGRSLRIVAERKS